MYLVTITKTWWSTRSLQTNFDAIWTWQKFTLSKFVGTTHFLWNVRGTPTLYFAENTKQPVWLCGRVMWKVDLFTNIIPLWVDNTYLVLIDCWLEWPIVYLIIYYMEWNLFVDRGCDLLCVLTIYLKKKIVDKRTIFVYLDHTYD